jgi:predicted transcriptional regulator
VRTQYGPKAKRKRTRTKNKFHICTSALLQIIPFTAKHNTKKTTQSDTMSTDHDEKIVEDIPQMRSVAMMSPVPMVPLARSIATPKAQLISSARFVEKKEIISPSPTGWELAVTDPLPAIYMLERTHTYVSNAGAKEVANRIANSLRLQSIAATFSTKEVCYRIYGQTLYTNQKDVH